MAVLPPRSKLRMEAIVPLIGNLEDRPTFLQLLLDLGQALLDGTALDLEGVIDVLSLKDNGGTFAADFAIALDRLTRDDSLPEGRKQVALLSIWRRIFVRDE